MRLKKILIILSISFIGLASNAALAESAHDTNNVIGVFLGSSTVKGEDDNEFTFGLEYEYHFSKLLGAGLIVEHSPDAHHNDDVSVVLAAVHIHPVGGLRLTVGAGREYIHGHHPHDVSMWRLGTAYDFHFDSFSIAPTINVDFIGDTKVYVVGAVGSYHF